MVAPPPRRGDASTLARPAGGGDDVAVVADDDAKASPGRARAPLPSLSLTASPESSFGTITGWQRIADDVRAEEEAAAAGAGGVLPPIPAREIAPASASAAAAAVAEVPDDDVDVSDAEIAFNDRYEFLREIGAGSFGRVFLARRRSDGKLFAVKVVDISAMDGKSRAETKNEVDVLKMLSHPNVVRYHEAALARGGGGSGGSGGRGGYGKPRELRIVMEYVSRGDLGERVKEIAKMRGNNGRNVPGSGVTCGGGGSLTEDEVMSYFTQIALALRHLHRKGILHRDLKLANVFVNEGEDGQDVVKLGDFGISKVLASQTGFCNTVVGTPYYLSPEMCMGRRYDAKSGAFYDANVFHPSPGWFLHYLIAWVPFN